MTTNFTYADLFAGIGGFAQALDSFGGECVYAVEIDKHAAAIYEHNWGHNPLGDIVVDTEGDVFNPQVWYGKTPDSPMDVLVGGFPCQPFSKSGAQRGMEETRGTLFFNIMQIVTAKKPAVLILENVRNLIGPNHHHEWEVIRDTLREAGYQTSSRAAVISPHQINPEHGGTPQTRERVFITATRLPDGVFHPDDLEPISIPEEAAMTREWNLLTDLPLDVIQVPEGTELSPSELLWINTWDEWVRKVRSLGLKPPSFPIREVVWTDSAEERAKLLLPTTPAWKANQLRKNWLFFEELTKALTLKGETETAWFADWRARVAEFPPSRRILEWQAQDAKRLRDCVISMRPSGLRAKRLTHLPALVAIAQTPIIAPLMRKLSIREATRLQGLHDTFDWNEQSDRLTYKQLGNGVNAGVVELVLKEHVKRDAHLLKQSEDGRRILAQVLSQTTELDKVE